jgi:acetyl-CoA C-acetyltransferase
VQFIESGATSLLPAVCPSTLAGLIGDGHPVGATGVRQVAAAFTQLTGKAARARSTAQSVFLPATSAAA